MKTKGIKRIALIASVILSTAGLSLGGIFALAGMSQSTQDDTSKSIPQGSPLSVGKEYSFMQGSDLTASFDKLFSDVSDENDGGGTLIHAIDLSQFENGKPKILLSNFSSKNPNVDELLQKSSLTLKRDGTPQVFIYHTHATEAYAEGDTYEEGHVFLSDDEHKNMVAVGKIFAEVLEAHGIGVIHDTSNHTAGGYNNAYSSSRKSLIGTLSDCDTIKISIDIHRDAVSRSGSECKVLTYIDGKPTAQVMLVVGSNHKNWESNLKTSLAFQTEINSLFPTLARPIYFSNGEYNQSLFENAMLLEVGSAGNSLDEAKKAASLAAEAFCKAFLE